MNPKESKDTITITIRVPRDLYEQIGEIATVEDRSLNYIIVRSIREALATRAGQRG